MKATLQPLPFMVLLFILPFPGTVALRLTCLAAVCLIVVISWPRLTPPPIPCKWAIALWGGVVIASLLFAVDPGYSLGEIKNEVGYALALLCAERALWPALGVQAALVCVWRWRDRAVAVGPLRLALAGIMVLGLVGGGVYVSERYRTGGDPQSPMAMGKDSRPRVWKKVGEEILAHPLTGAGFGRAVMSKAYPALLTADEDGEFWHPHNLVLEYGISAGVPGILAVLALFGSLARRFWRLACRGERLARLTGLAGTAMVAGVLARNMANDFFVRDGALLFWALGGMLFGYALRREFSRGEDGADPRSARRGIVAAGASAGDRRRNA
jgi:hypothetical protein